MESIDIIEINSTNIDREHICCAIGNDKENRERAETKKQWLRERFEEGLIFKRLNDRGKVFIEYMPVEKSWKPIFGENYYVINCLWVSGKFKGEGISKKLFEECLKDAKKNKKDGIVVITSTSVKPFLTDKKFYEKIGFKKVESAYPYFELLEYKINENGVTPKFTEKVVKGEADEKEGFFISYSNQCPFMEEYVERMRVKILEKGIGCSVTKIKSAKEAQMIGSPFGTLGIYYKGKLVAHELMPDKKLEQFIEETTVDNCNI